MDDMMEIVDNERLPSSDSSLSEGGNLLELEEQENFPVVLVQENINAIPVPPPVNIPPPYAVSGQCAVCSKGAPKSIFHPYPHHCPLAKLYE